MFISYFKSTMTYHIVYNNIHTGKRNRKNTKTSDEEMAKAIMRKFEIEYNKQSQIHKSQIADNSNSKNLVIISEPKINDDKEYTIMDTLPLIQNYYKNQNNNIEVQQNVRRNYFYLIEICGNKKLSEYKMLDFENYKANRIQLVKPGTVNCELRNLRSYFSRFIDFELLLKHPMNKVKYLDNFNVRLEFKKEEMKKILDEIKRTGDDLMHYTINIAYLTGLRLGELINLKWSDINFSENLIYVLNKSEEGFTTKSGNERFIPIEKNLKNILIELQSKRKESDYDYVIAKQNGFKYNPDFISLQFRTLIKKLGINKKHSFHSLRHTFATNYLAAGGGIYNLQQILGHSKISTTEKYLHRNKDVMINEMSSLNLAV